MYGRVGTLAAMSLIHGGASFSLFSHTVFYFLCGHDAAKLHPKIEEVADIACKDFLYKVGIPLHACIRMYVYKLNRSCISLCISLSMVVINSRDCHGFGKIHASVSHLTSDFR